MKKVILGLVAAIFAVSSIAQDGAKAKKTPQEMASKKADKMKSELNLSPDQRSYVYTILLDNMNKIKAVKDKYPNDEKAAKAEIKPLKDACDASIKKILTPEQITKWDAMKKEHKEKMKNKKGKEKNDSDH